ncbi:GGDEF domain-containing protein [Azotobacter vinelandii]|uniref:GGDEF domain-containing protein n=1 Tax=Azotobacter vinelandii TaxID=354 RepID=UPI0026659D46|nr:sensor domain-containing diguanylate cyclase [Azotobacter vinelandii]WKN20908.1 diguanylate cyclase [Azotobacter vinelandii]
MAPRPNGSGMASEGWRHAIGARKVSPPGPGPSLSMTLHLPTLLLTVVYVLILLGLLMLHAWWRSEGESTLGYMAGTLLVAAAGMLLGSLRGIGIDTLSIVLGNMLLQLSGGLGWTTSRVFAGRPAWWPGIMGGALLWGLLCLWPTFLASLPLRVAIANLLVIFYSALGAWELWRVRASLTVSVAPALGMLVLHGTFYCLRLSFDRGASIGLRWSESGADFMAWMVLEAFLFANGIAFATLAMVRERAEQRYRAVAYRDPLTDIGNRRAFTSGGEVLLARCAAEGRPAALLLCDLDHFKRLNDTHGHAMGDAALVAFGRLLALGVRQQDICGRIGGEEFACLLPGADRTVSLQVAERIRQACSELSLEPGVRVSVSIGVASSEQAGYDLSRLLALSDQALYRAKANGRDRVECSAD